MRDLVLVALLCATALPRTAQTKILTENSAPEETASVINATDHPWIASKSFVGELEKYSPPLSKLVAVKQQAYPSGKYWHDDVAKGIVDIGDEGNRVYEFFTVTRKGSTWKFAINESRVDENGTRWADETKPPKEMVTVKRTEWKLQRGVSSPK